MAVSRRIDGNKTNTIQSSYAKTRPNKKLFITEEPTEDEASKIVNRSQSIEIQKKTKRYRNFKTVHIKGGQMEKNEVEQVLN